MLFQPHFKNLKVAPRSKVILIKNIPYVVGDGKNQAINAIIIDWKETLSEQSKKIAKWTGDL